MKKFSAVFLTVLGLLSPFASISACESYISLSTSEIKELRGKLTEPDIDSLDRMHAFHQMVCSDSPTIRQYTLQEGMKIAKDPLVRNEIMLMALMQKTRIDIELGSTNDQTKQDKDFIAKYGGVFSKQVSVNSAEEGCVDLHNSDCVVGTSLFIRGDTVEFNYFDIRGEFRLSNSGELVGVIRADDQKFYTRIPAIIRLF